jgi:D-serine deaminase-like pyridoxal phosphate-dependent protein
MNSLHLIGLSVEQIPTPALLVDLDALVRNIERMSSDMAKARTNVRPHGKTHKTPAIAHLQMEAGAVGLCCATVGEAEVMAAAGIKNILIANEMVTEVAIRRTVNLARHTSVMVPVDNTKNVRDLSAAARQYSSRLDVLVDIDVGMGRCGARSMEQAIELARAVRDCPGLRLRGLFGYEGHVQFIPDRDERTEKGRAANQLLADAAKTLSGMGFDIEIVSGAGTGTYDIAVGFPGITEIEPGSYVFMDATYNKLELPFEQSLTVLTSVVSRPTDDLVILDAGSKGISPERFNPLVRGYESAIEISSLHEEHALGTIRNGVDPRPGDKMQLIPSHCCGTVNLYDQMYVTRNGVVEAIWPIAARRA